MTADRGDKVEMTQEEQHFLSDVRVRMSVSHLVHMLEHTSAHFRILHMSRGNLIFFVS